MNRDTAIPETMMQAAELYGTGWLMSGTAFDECIFELAGRITDNLKASGRCKAYTDLSDLFRASVAGVAAGLAIGKHIERQRLQ